LEATIVTVIALAKESWSGIQNIPRIAKEEPVFQPVYPKNLKSDKDQILSKISPETASQLSPNIPVPS